MQIFCPSMSDVEEEMREMTLFALNQIKEFGILGQIFDVFLLKFKDLYPKNVLKKYTLIWIDVYRKAYAEIPTGLQTFFQSAMMNSVHESNSDPNTDSDSESDSDSDSDADSDTDLEMQMEILDLNDYEDEDSDSDSGSDLFAFEDAETFFLPVSEDNLEICFHLLNTLAQVYRDAGY